MVSDARLTSWRVLRVLFPWVALRALQIFLEPLGSCVPHEDSTLASKKEEANHKYHALTINQSNACFLCCASADHSLNTAHNRKKRTRLSGIARRVDTHLLHSPSS
jgi:hypothetical protein